MDQLQESILQTAARMFHQKGIRNVSIDDICSELRISKKTFYTHFQQKEELVDAVLIYSKTKELEKFSKNLHGKNAIDALIYIVKEIKKHADCQPHALWYDVQKFYPKLFERHEVEKMERIRTGFEINLQQGNCRRLLSERPRCGTYLTIPYSANEINFRNDGTILQKIHKTTPARFLY